jgi:predicted nuclease with RNAse H fold
VWAGVDVGGRRKGYDVAVVDDERLLDIIRHLPTPSAVLKALEAHAPAIVAVDSPRGPAPAGKALREEERELRNAICGIRWTPDQATLDAGGPYYDWIRRGLELHRTLDRHGGWEVIEVFPTASWTRWDDRRRATRAAWTKRVMALLPVRGLPSRTNQDVRDAIAAAITARQHAAGTTESFGPIVVPRPGLPA